MIINLNSLSVTVAGMPAFMKLVKLQKKLDKAIPNGLHTVSYEKIERDLGKIILELSDNIDAAMAASAVREMVARHGDKI